MSLQKRSKKPKAKNVTMESVQELHFQDQHQEGCLESTEKPSNCFSSATSKLKSTIVSFDVAKIFSNWRILIPSCLRSGPDMPLSYPPARVYQVWPGKNVFFFQGRVICGPDPRGLILSTISVLLSDWIFLVYIDDPSSKHLILTSVFAMILAASVIVTLLLTATSDPGIIPRNQTSPLEEVGTTVRTRSLRITVDGIEIKVKYCRICNIFRPPRSSHCTVCDNCVEKFDHHCPWIGQCIGLRNYRFYLLLISLALAFYIYTLTFSLRRIRLKMDSTDSGVFNLLRSVPETFSLAVFSFIAIWFLGSLLAFHAFLVSKNQTSHERYKERYQNSRNPYNKGALQNIKECVFDRLLRPRVDFRAVYEPNSGSEVQ